MRHLHRNVLLVAAVALALDAVAFALLGIGFAAMVAVGLLIVGAFMLAGLIVFEEEIHQPGLQERSGGDDRHGYHPAR